LPRSVAIEDKVETAMPRAFVLGFILLVVVISVSLTPGVRAINGPDTTMIAVTAVSYDPCIAAGQDAYSNLYSLEGPAGEGWIIDMNFGLVNGPSNNVAPGSFLFQLIDNSNNHQVGSYGDVNDNWIAQGPVSYGTITASFSSTFTLSIFISNGGSQSQCYNAVAQGWYA
jgi:hypothetical protein